MDRAAKDDAERERNRAELYRPPRDTPIPAPPAAGQGETRPQPATPPRRRGMTKAQAQEILGQVASEDAKLGRRRQA